MPTLVYSLDFDGCLFNERYLQACEILTLLHSSEPYDYGWLDRFAFNPYFSLLAMTDKQLNHDSTETRVDKETFKSLLKTKYDDWKSTKFINQELFVKPDESVLYWLAKVWYNKKYESNEARYSGLATLCLDEETDARLKQGEDILSFFQTSSTRLPSLFDLLVFANQDLFDELIKTSQSKEIAKIILMIGSNRQSAIDDFSNAGNGKGSCFPHLIALTNYLNKCSKSRKFKYDDLLLADVYQHLITGKQIKPGDSLNIAIDALTDGFHYNERPGEMATWLFDESKVSILYTQLHYIAKKYKASAKNPIQFYFLDDRGECEGNLNILEALYNWFDPTKEGESDKIASHVTLSLNLYRGTTLPDNMALIRGSGGIDNGYARTLYHMACQCLPSIGANWKEAKKSKLVLSSINFSFGLSDVDIQNLRGLESKAEIEPSSGETEENRSKQSKKKKTISFRRLGRPKPKSLPASPTPSADNKAGTAPTSKSSIGRFFPAAKSKSACYHSGRAGATETVTRNRSRLVLDKNDLPEKIRRDLNIS